MAFIEKLMLLVKEATERRTISKAELLLREGEVEKNLYYIEKGAVRIFLLTEHEEHTIRLGYEGSFINSLSSFIKGTPSEFYIEAIRKTTVTVIPKEQLLKMVYQDEESLKQYCSFMEMVITQQIEREIDLLTVSPTERLKRVLERSPNVFQEVPLKYIASYLRMTPETLSRLRNP
jgi:CRP-like cAMP-binding protein